MKLAPQTRSKNKRTITAWRMTLGCRMARQSGLLSESGEPLDFLLINTSNGLLILTKDEFVQTIDYNGITSDVYRHNNIYFGEITSLPFSPTWYATSLDKAEQAFRKTADLYAPI